MSECTKQTADCTEDAEAQKQFAIDMTAQHEKTHGRRKQMRNGYGRDGELERNLYGEDWCEQAADAKTRNSSNRSSDNGYEEKCGFKQLAMHKIVARLEIPAERSNKRGGSVQVFYVNHLVRRMHVAIRHGQNHGGHTFARKENSIRIR